MRLINSKSAEAHSWTHGCCHVIMTPWTRTDCCLEMEDRGGQQSLAAILASFTCPVRTVLGYPADEAKHPACLLQAPPLSRQVRRRSVKPPPLRLALAPELGKFARHETTPRACAPRCAAPAEARQADERRQTTRRAPPFSVSSQRTGWNFGLLSPVPASSDCFLQFLSVWRPASPYNASAPLLRKTSSQRPA